MSSTHGGCPPLPLKKKDANPGFINEAWTRIDKPGIYRGQCAELCGKDHGFMPIVVQALPEAEFDAWVEEQNKPPMPPRKPHRPRYRKH